MQRQIKMQVYHRRYSTCSAAWSSLSLPLPPFPTTAAAPWDHPSDAKQLLPSEFRNSHRQLGAASGQGSTPSAVTNGTDTATFHCSPRATGCHQAAKVPVHQHRRTGLVFSEEVFTFVWVQLKELSTCVFPYPAEVLLGGRPALQLLSVPSNPCLLHFISFIYYKGVQRHVNQLAKKEYSYTVGTCGMASDTRD